MQIKLKKAKSIRGVLEKAGTIVDVGDLTGQALIDSGDAESVAAKPKKKKASE